MSTTERVLGRAKAIITEEIERTGFRVCRILLFGSRAKGKARPDSDWDFFVVVDREASFHEREDLASRICWRLAQEGIFADVFVQSEKTVEERKTDTGRLTYYVLKEGVPV
ncbi:nucleotidyltransferase domain-containing protein [Candidatus Bipolaricaulota bacterium]|nr:nucleotidyltransferase domain-containing protein [Candidatus Bipolaricaulota bacterium]